MKTSSILVLSLFTLSEAAAALITPNLIFSHDDGFAEDSIGSTTPTDQVIFLNAFQTGAQISVLGVEIAFGPNPGLGAPVDVYLWSDPDNDGNPINAVLLQTVSGVYSDINFVSADPLIFADFGLTPHQFQAGDYFFVGFQSTGYGLIDTDSTANSSYVFSDFVSTQTDPANLGAASAGGNINAFVNPGNLTIRAIAYIPEPSTYLACISGLGLAGFLYYRSRRKKAAETE